MPSGSRKLTPEPYGASLIPPCSMPSSSSRRDPLLELGAVGAAEGDVVEADAELAERARPAPASGAGAGRAACRCRAGTRCGGCRGRCPRRAPARRRAASSYQGTLTDEVAHGERDVGERGERRSWSVPSFVACRAACTGRRSSRCRMSVRRTGGEHDRGTAVLTGRHRCAATEPTRRAAVSALEQLRLEGAIFFRSELTERVRVRVDAARRSPTRCIPGAERLILFHIVARGSCWVAGDDGERHWAERRRRDRAALRRPATSSAARRRPSACRSSRCSTRCRGATCRCIRHGGGGERTDLVCGYLHSDDPLFDPGDAGRSRRRSSCALPTGPGGGLGAGEHRLRARRRSAVEREPERHRDPAARAGAHRGAPRCTSRPRRPPTTAGSPRCTTRCSRRRSRCCTASRSAAGRSPTSRRPRRCRARCSTSASARCSAGRRSATSPSGACTSPRSCSPRPTSASSPIARRVGYDSEEAFSRAFKRAHGLSPSHWRAARATPLAPREHA